MLFSKKRSVFIAGIIEGLVLLTVLFGIYGYLINSVDMSLFLIFAIMIFVSSMVSLWFNAKDKKYRHTWRENGKLMISNGIIVVFIATFALIIVYILWTRHSILFW